MMMEFQFMPSVEYFMATRSKENPHWQKVYELCGEKDIEINTEPKECDISVVFGGTLVNPIPLKGKKVLALKKDEWRMVKWDMIYAAILEEYYDHFIDTTRLNPKDTLQLIQKECENL